MHRRRQQEPVPGRAAPHRAPLRGRRPRAIQPHHSVLVPPSRRDPRHGLPHRSRIAAPTPPVHPAHTRCGRARPALTRHAAARSPHRNDDPTRTIAKAADPSPSWRRSLRATQASARPLGPPRLGQLRASCVVRGHAGPRHRVLGRARYPGTIEGRWRFTGGTARCRCVFAAVP